MAASWYFFQTLCQLANNRIPSNLDGISFLPELFNKKQSSHPYLYWEYYNYNYNWYKPGNKLPRNFLQSVAVRYGKWKAVKNNIFRNKEAAIELYDLENDPGEKKNVAQKNSAIIQKSKRNICKRAPLLIPPYFPYAEDGKKPNCISLILRRHSR